MISGRMGGREFDRLTASEPITEGGRPEKDEKLGIECRVSDTRSTRQLRAINRAPGCVRRMYDRDPLAVDLAAKCGTRASRTCCGGREHR